jgi:hypothetical protein
MWWAAGGEGGTMEFVMKGRRRLNPAVEWSTAEWNDQPAPTVNQLRRWLDEQSAEFGDKLIAVGTEGSSRFISIKVDR